jgi:putative flippase GtrA
MNGDGLEFARHAGGLVNSRFARFVLVGVTAAAVNIFSRVLISNFVRFEYAVALAFPIALTFAFVLSRFFVFEVSKRPVWEQYLRFWLVNLVALIQVWLISVGLSYWVLPAIGWTFYPELFAHTIAVCSPVLTSYYAHKVFTFSEKIG